MKKSLLVRCGTARSPGMGGTAALAPVATMAFLKVMGDAMPSTCTV